MAYEPQDRYRRRTLLKARYFDQSNETRLWNLRRAAKDMIGVAPEIRACVPFFLSHPRAVFMPSIQDGANVFGPSDQDPPSWFISCSRDTHGYEADFHLALAYIALTSVTKLQVHTLLITESGSGIIECDPIVDQVRKEIEELRACGMWVTE